MASTTNEPSVKFTYFRDPISPRTVTVARMLDGDKMYIDWAVNRMSRANVAYAQHNYEPLWHGDIFCKSIAREIARGRVMKRRHEVTLTGEDRKLEQMVNFRLTTPPQFIRDIVMRACAERARELSEKTIEQLQPILTADVSSET